MPRNSIKKKEVKDMLEELDNLLDALMNIDDKLNELQRINSMVIVTCDACENGNDIKYDVANVMVFIQEQIDSLDDDIRSNVSKCNALTRNIQETIKKEIVNMEELMDNELINTSAIETIDSREVAEMVGIQHKDLLKKVRNYQQILESSKIAPSGFLYSKHL